MALTVLDAGIVIAVLSARDAHHAAARAALTAALRDADVLVVPASAYAETLVEPYQRRIAAVREVKAFLAALPARIEPIDAAVADTAARFRARHRSLKLPDALIIATAEAIGADRILTTDRGWPQNVGIAVEVVGRPRPARARRRVGRP